MATPSNYPDIGVLGEDFVAQWMRLQGWQILHRRWRCRFGEIDIIAQREPDCILAFVEVKTRSPGSWDAGGRYAIASAKQAKLLRTATMFLTNNPHKADYQCRFDVAIVSYQPQATSAKFTLQEYIPAAFDAG